MHYYYFKIDADILNAGMLFICNLLNSSVNSKLYYLAGPQLKVVSTMSVGYGEFINNQTGVSPSLINFTKFQSM